MSPDVTSALLHETERVRYRRVVRIVSATIFCMLVATFIVACTQHLPCRDGTIFVEIETRAAIGSDISEVRRLLVSVRTVHIHTTRKGVDVEVTPSAPYARVVLEVYRKERFGWWPTVRRRLDYVSEARIPVRGGLLVRVVLVDRDGWTPLATSRAVLLKRR